MRMNDVAVAWMMTSLFTKPVWVALMQIGTWSHVSISLASAAVCDFSAMRLPAGASLAGRVMVMTEYLVGPAHAAVFKSLILDKSRRSRLRHGVLSWGCCRTSVRSRVFER
jgi:hypothetical protein